MLKSLVLLTLSAVFAFAINLNTASKSELMQIKGIGEKKAQSIIAYRKKHKIKNAEDLQNIKGFGKGLISNVKNDVRKKSVAKKSAAKTKKQTKMQKSDAKKKAATHKSQTKKQMKKGSKKFKTREKKMKKKALKKQQKGMKKSNKNF